MSKTNYQFKRKKTKTKEETKEGKVKGNKASTIVDNIPLCVVNALVSFYLKYTIAMKL